jgi:hypothetical protein
VLAQSLYDDETAMCVGDGAELLVAQRPELTTRVVAYAVDFVAILAAKAAQKADNIAAKTFPFYMREADVTISERR